MSVPCFWSWHDHRESPESMHPKGLPLRHICKLHIYQVSGLTPVRAWMSEKTGHDCDHFQAAPDIDVAMRDGTLRRRYLLMLQVLLPFLGTILDKIFPDAQKSAEAKQS